jgi:hypothetical protein
MAKLNLTDYSDPKLIALYNSRAAADINDPILKDIEAEQALRKLLANRQAGAAQHFDAKAAKAQEAERERRHQETITKAHTAIDLVEKAGANLQQLPPGVGTAYNAILENFLAASQCVVEAFGNIDRPEISHVLDMSLQNDLVNAGVPLRSFGFDADRPSVGAAVRRVCDDMRTTIQQAEQARTRKVAA